MDNITWIEDHQRFCRLFFISNLACCKFVALKENTLSLILFKNITVIRPSTLLMGGGLWFTIKGGTGKDSEPFHQKIECYSFPSCLTPSLHWLQTTYWEKVSLIAIKEILPKIFPMVHIFSFIITTYLKNFIGVRTLSTKQYPAELSPWSIPPVFPILPKMFPLLSFCLFSPSFMDCPTSSPKPTVWGKPCRWGKNPPNQIAIFM